MTMFNRRDTLLGVVAAGGLAATQVAQAADPPQPSRGPGMGGTDPGPRNLPIDAANPNMLNPPPTDSGTLPNLRFRFSDAPMKQYTGGWTRQVSVRELGISKPIAGVDMRLNAGGVRELHWHKQAEWAFMLYGSARISAVDELGRNFVDDVGPGDLWYFPAGIPHSIQGLAADGCEFLLIFDDGEFDEDSTFLLSDWFRHIPPDILARNIGVPAENFRSLPDPSTRYIFPLPVPGSLNADRIAGATPAPRTFSHHMTAQTPVSSNGGKVWVTDSSIFPMSQNIAAALVEVPPGGLRELHWHPNTDEWQYYIEGKGRMGVFAAHGQARTYDFTAGDVGFVPFAMGHYIQNTGDTPLRFLEVFKSSYYADVSLNQWLALTPPELVRGHMGFDDTVMNALAQRRAKTPIL